MTTVKVKIRKSTVPGKSAVIYYQLCHKQETKQITTRMRVHPDQWDPQREIPDVYTAETPENQKKLIGQIQKDRKHLLRIIQHLDTRSSDYALEEVIRLFRKKQSQVTLFHYFERQIAHLKARGKLGTARNYYRTFCSFSQFLNGEDISFSQFDEGLVTEYNEWLERRNVVRNTQSFYLRILRSVYHKAVHDEIVEQTFPFRNVYTGIDRTRKRAISEELILEMQKLDVGNSAALALARDLFLFSYAARGMAFVDLALLRKKDLSGDRMTYVRRKTGQTLVVRLEPVAVAIIERYAGVNGNSPYVFPLLDSTDPAVAFTQYQTALGYHNRQLKRLGQLLGTNQSLSSYTARHTWATVARNHEIPLAVISAGMGHASEKTTRIYLASLENSVIDQANQNILAKLNG